MQRRDKGFSVDLGRSDVSGSLSGQKEGGIQVHLRSKRIDVDQLAESGLERLLSGTATSSTRKTDPSTQGVHPSPEPARSEAVLSTPEGSKVGKSAPLWIDMPILKKPIRLPDVQFDWELEEFGGSAAKVEKLVSSLMPNRQARPSSCSAGAGISPDVGASDREGQDTDACATGDCRRHLAARCL